MTERLPKRQHTVKVRTDAGAAFSDLVVRVFRLDGLLTAAGDALAEPTGQTTARWRVLAAIEREAMSVSAVAHAWSLARQSVQRVADLLEEEGLVAYEDNPAHRRAKLMRLTPKGRAALRRIQAAQRAWANDLGAAVGEDELRTASRTLERVIERLER